MAKRIHADRPLTNTEKSTRWRVKNLERCAAYKAELRKKDPDKFAAYDKKKRLKNPEKIKAQHKKWRDKNREKLRAESRGKYTGSSKVRMREWRKKNPLKAVETIHIRLARKRNAPGTHTADDLQVILEKQNHLCANAYCQIVLTARTRSLDHKIPLATSGSNWPDNLQWLCRPCNSRKGTLPLSVWIAREAERER